MSMTERGLFFPRGFFFLTAPLAITSYHTNKTRLAEAPFGPGGDDNGPGLEPPPQNRIGIVMALCRAAGGLRQPPESRAFPTSKLTIYLDDASSFEPSQQTSDIDYSMMHDARTYRRSGGICTVCTNLWKPEKSAHQPTRVGVD